MKLVGLKILPTFLVMILIASVPVVPAYAFLDEVDSLLGGGDSDSGDPPDVGSIVDQNNNLLLRYQSALVNLLTSQERFAEALGIKEGGQRAQSTAELLKEGTVDEDVLEQAEAVTAENNKLIKQKISEGVELDAESKKLYGLALIPYAKGTFDAVLLYPEFGKQAQNVNMAISSLSSNPLAAVDLLKLTTGTGAAVVYVATSLPTLGKEWIDNSWTLISFGKDNDVDVSEATEVMGDVEF